MPTTMVLRQDHKLLRKQLDLIETALHMGPDAGPALREMCFLLGQMLRTHMAREEEMLEPFQQPVYSLTQYWIGRPHAAQYAALLDVNTLLLSDLTVPARAARMIERLAQGLRTQMAEEDGDLFPVIDELELEHLRRRGVDVYGLQHALRAACN